MKLSQSNVTSCNLEPNWDKSSDKSNAEVQGLVTSRRETKAAEQREREIEKVTSLGIYQSDPFFIPRGSKSCGEGQSLATRAPVKIVIHRHITLRLCFCE
ncbi:hypothetical protein J6590_065461 [Homalodisca vitripennis]|nr:hypothetical protein J6590_065461 [Homalodisca vitripennis]